MLAQTLGIIILGLFGLSLYYYVRIHAQPMRAMQYACCYQTAQVGVKVYEAEIRKQVGKLKGRELTADE